MKIQRRRRSGIVVVMFTSGTVLPVYRPKYYLIGGSYFSTSTAAAAIAPGRGKCDILGKEVFRTWVLVKMVGAEEVNVGVEVEHIRGSGRKRMILFGEKKIRGGREKGISCSGNGG